MCGASRIKRNEFMQSVHTDPGEAHDEAVDELQRKEQHTGCEEPVREFL